MKSYRILTLIGVMFFSVLVNFSCSKKDLLPAEVTVSEIQTGYIEPIVLVREPRMLGNVKLTAPYTININAPFNILAEVECGRVGIERGYILAADGITKIYHGLTCSTANLQWEFIVGFQCYTTDAQWNGSLSTPGTYVYRLKHNGSDGNCDGLGGGDRTGDCDFTGMQMNCFTIEAKDGCENLFTGQARSCGYEREAVYTFRSKDALSYLKIQGGLTNFTGANAIISISGGNLTATQSMPGGSSNRTVTIEGSVGACETVTIHMTWNSFNSGGVITGNWSASNNGGTDVAPQVPGLTCNTPL